MQNGIDSLIRRARCDTLGDAFTRSAERHGDKPALLFEQRSWTYAELERAGNRVAHALLAHGLRQGDRVTAFGGNSDAYVLLWLACLKAGLVHVPVNHALTTAELRYIIEQSGSGALFHEFGDEAVVSPLLGEMALSGTFQQGEGVDVLRMAQTGEGAAPPGLEGGGERLAQILYTSGTTAAPKGAMLTHAGLMAEYVSAIADLEIVADDFSLAALPLYHSAQMHVFMMPQLLMGGRARILRHAQADACLRAIAEEHITSFFAPPTVWISLLRHPDFDGFDLSSLAKGYYGASIMPLPVVQELAQRLPVRLFNCYGQSEIGPLATVLRPEEHAQRPASAGRPVLNVRTRIVDDQDQPLPAGAVGEIVHRSPQLLLGYWNQPEETACAFRNGWFHSGDLGYLDEGGYLYIVDRVKDVIKSGGIQISSREVEECLYRHPAVSEVAVIAMSDPRWVEVVTAVVALREGMRADEAELIAHCRRYLAAFKAPKRVFFRDQLPRNASGKLLKRELRDLYAVDDRA